MILSTSKGSKKSVDYGGDDADADAESRGDMLLARFSKGKRDCRHADRRAEGHQDEFIAHGRLMSELF